MKSATQKTPILMLCLIPFHVRLVLDHDIDLGDRSINLDDHGINLDDCGIDLGDHNIDLDYCTIA